MPRRSQDIMFGDLQAKVLTKVAELYWEQQDQITDEHINALISETLSQLREEGGQRYCVQLVGPFYCPQNNGTS